MKKKISGGKLKKNKRAGRVFSEKIVTEKYRENSKTIAAVFFAVPFVFLAIICAWQGVFLLVFEEKKDHYEKLSVLLQETKKDVLSLENYLSDLEKCESDLEKRNYESGEMF